MKPLSKRDNEKKSETYLFYKWEFLKRKQEMLSPVKEEFRKKLISRTIEIHESGNKLTITSWLTHPDVLTSILDPKKINLVVSINLEAHNWVIDVFFERLVNYNRERGGHVSLRSIILT